MVYSSPEQVHEIVDAIDALISTENHFSQILGHHRGAEVRATYPGAEDRLPRYGRQHANWARPSTEVPELVPRAWSAAIHEPYNFVYMRRNKEVVEAPRPRAIAEIALGSDLRAEHAKFDVYGLPIYRAGDWSPVEWTAREASQDGELAIFASPIWLGSASVVVAAEEGHFALDPIEKQAQLETNIRGFGRISREQQAARTSYRLTPEGGEFLLTILANTKAFADSLELAENHG